MAIALEFIQVMRRAVSEIFHKLFLQRAARMFNHSPAR
jgi:hypothetical protein